MQGYTGYSSKLKGRNAAGSPVGLSSGAKVSSQIPPLFLPLEPDSSLMLNVPDHLASFFSFFTSLFSGRKVTQLLGLCVPQF